MTRLMLLVDVPDSASPDVVVQQLDNNWVTGQGLTLALPSGFKADVVLASVEVDSWEPAHVRP